MARFKWGRFEGVKGPGPVFLIPIIHSGVKVDTRIEVIDIPRQTNITKDNAPIDIDFLIYMRVMTEDAQKAILEVECCQSANVGRIRTRENCRYGEPALSSLTVRL